MKDAVHWVVARLAQASVVQEGTQWKAKFQGKELGAFGSPGAALKAYRDAAREKHGERALLPEDADIDRALKDMDEGKGAAPADAPAPRS